MSQAVVPLPMNEGRPRISSRIGERTIVLLDDVAAVHVAVGHPERPHHRVHPGRASGGRAPDRLEHFVRGRRLSRPASATGGRRAAFRGGDPAQAAQSSTAIASFSVDAAGKRARAVQAAPAPARRSWTNSRRGPGYRRARPRVSAPSAGVFVPTQRRDQSGGGVSLGSPKTGPTLVEERRPCRRSPRPQGDVSPGQRDATRTSPCTFFVATSRRSTRTITWRVPAGPGPRYGRRTLRGGPATDRRRRKGTAQAISAFRSPGGPRARPAPHR